MLSVEFTIGTPSYGFTWLWRPKFFCWGKAVEVRWLCGNVAIEWHWS